MFRKRRRSKENVETVVQAEPCNENECLTEVKNDCETESCFPMPTSSGKQCEARVLSTRVMNECANEPIPLGNKLIAKIPVVLAEALVQIDLESIIRLEEKALEIKRVQKNVHINQCKLLFGTNKLFLSGFVRKNIEYATAACVSRGGISGDIRHTTVNIPFECVTAITFCTTDGGKGGKGSSGKGSDGKGGDSKGKDKNGQNCFLPQFTLNIPGQDAEIELLNNCMLGMNSRERDFIDFESFTEKPFCELVFAFISEADIECEHFPVDGNPDEHAFQTVREKMVLNLMVKVLQNQQVSIPGAKVVIPGESDD